MLQRHKTPPCSRCGQRLVINPFSSTPAMLGFVLDNKTINLCKNCISLLGCLETDEEKEEFFSGIGVDDE